MLGVTQAADLYATRLEEGLWGGLLVAVTLAIHGFGMLWTLRAVHEIRARFQRHESFSLGMTIIILASWMLLMVHMIEVAVWAHFFLWKNAVAGAINNLSICYYFALMDYTTLGSNYNLRTDCRLLEGMIGIAGLLTFAWSTGILLTIAQEYQERYMSLLKARRGLRGTGPPATYTDSPDL